jgi:cyclophilin family peptidyl-prolyl cis-trans isomerase
MMAPSSIASSLTSWCKAEASPQIKNEATNGLKNLRGTIAMARTGVVDSATCQFFINVKDNTFLNHTSPNPQGYGYAVFGKVSKGMDVVDAIVSVKRGRKGPHDDVPLETISITSAKVA